MPPAARPKRRATVRLHRTQADFHHCPSLYRGFVGGRGSGKSWAISYDLIRRARKGRLYMMVSPTYTILRDTDLRAFSALARELGALGEVKASPPEVRLTTGAEVLFRSADDPDRLRGPNLSGVALNEASLMHQDAYDISIASLREGGEQGFLTAGFTPAGLSHWTYEVFGQDPPRPDTAVFVAHTRDNPFLPEGFARTLALQYSPQRARQELGGEFVQLEGAEWPPEYFPPSVVVPQRHWPERWLCSALALDPALGEGERGRPPPGNRPPQPGCYAAFVFVGVDERRVLWCDAWLSQSWDAQALVGMSFDLLRATGAGALAVETNFGQAFLCELLKAEARRRNVPLPLYGFNQIEDKEVRIRQTLTPFLAQGRLRFREDGPGAKLLLAQMRDFPVGKYRDGADALQMAVVMSDWLLGHKPGGATPRAVR